jgi:hypothetical protein
MRARCGHCSACTSDQMLRRILPTAERTVTPVRQQKKQEAIDKGSAIRERPLGFKGGSEILTSGSIALMCPALLARHRDRWPMCGRPAEFKEGERKYSDGSNAVMCPASSCGIVTAGPDRFRERHPNRWAASMCHGPARILSFVGSTDHYLLLRP